jgi:hypothetical protein
LKTEPLARIEGKISRFIENKALAVAFLKREFGMIAGTAPKKTINSEKKASHISYQRRRYFGTGN